MAVLPVRKIAMAGVLSAISVALGLTRLGYLPWFSGASLTILHVPVILGALMEGPVVGLFVGLVFGLTSLIQAAIAPTGPIDVAFVNPLVSILPRLLVGPATYLVFIAVRGRGTPSALRETIAAALGSFAGSAANTVFVLSGLSLLSFLPWGVSATVAVANGLPEAAVATIVSVAVYSAWKRLATGSKKSSLADEEGGA